MPQQCQAHVLQLCWHQQLPQGCQQVLVAREELRRGQPIDALGKLLNGRPAKSCVANEGQSAVLWHGSSKRHGPFKMLRSWVPTGEAVAGTHIQG